MVNLSAHKAHAFIRMGQSTSYAVPMTIECLQSNREEIAWSEGCRLIWEKIHRSHSWLSYGCIADNVQYMPALFLSDNEWNCANNMLNIYKWSMSFLYVC